MLLVDKVEKHFLGKHILLIINNWTGKFESVYLKARLL